MQDRADYVKSVLDEANLMDSPFDQLRCWLNEAREAKIVEPTAMCLSTVATDGRPSSRFVLLRELDERGLVFFTNYESRKGRELAANPYAALSFWWAALERQVRVEGRIERTAEEESDAYFYSRPPVSRFASAASPQSQTVTSRDELEEYVRALVEHYPNGDVPRPEHWGGFRLVPDRFEFWQGRRARLHDRLAYALRGAAWDVSRLAP